MITLEKLTKELNFNQTDEVIAGLWTTGTNVPKSSGSDDRYSGTISVGYKGVGISVDWSFTHTWT